MKTQEILDKTFDVNEVITKEELKKLIFSLHKIELSNDNVDNIIYFIDYCKENEHDVSVNIEWFFLYLLDNMNEKNMKLIKKILLHNKNITIKMSKWVEEQNKTHVYPNTVWNKGWTNLSFEEASEKLKNESNEQN